MRNGIRTRAIDAVLRTPSAETAYQRTGLGTPLLLLRARIVRGPDPVRDALAATFRVLMPQVESCAGGVVRLAGAPGLVDARGWLRDLIEGLGLSGAPVVADLAFATAVLDLARAEPDRVGRVALLVDAGSATAGAGLAAMRRFLSEPRPGP